MIPTNILILISIFAASLLAYKYLPSYFSEKGKNLATKEDIEEITNKVERVKNEYIVEAEKLKAALSGETERLKVALAFQSETYKLVAKKRFESILALWSSSEALLTDTNFSGRESIRASMKRIDESLAKLSRYSILLSPDVLIAIREYLTRIGTVLTNSKKKFQEGSVNSEQVAQIIGSVSPIIGIFSPAGGVASSVLGALVPQIVPSLNDFLERFRRGAALSARSTLEAALRSELGVHVTESKIVDPARA